MVFYVPCGVLLCYLIVNCGGFGPCCVLIGFEASVLFQDLGFGGLGFGGSKVWGLLRVWLFPKGRVSLKLPLLPIRHVPGTLHMLYLPVLLNFIPGSLNQAAGKLLKSFSEEGGLQRRVATVSYPLLCKIPKENSHDATIPKP